MKVAVDGLLEQIRGVWRHRRIAVQIAWAVAFLAWFAILAWPDSYRATARVYVDTSSALRPLLQGIAVEQDIEARMNIVREQMLGDDKLEKVALAAGLFAENASRKEKTDTYNSIRDRTLIDTTLPTSARRDRAPTADRIFTVSYDNSDRAKALAVVDALLKSLVTDTQVGTSSGSSEAQGFLQQQLKEYERRLSESEASLAEFKKGNVGLVPGQNQGDYFSRLQSEITAKKRAETSLELATRRKAELTRQLRSEQPFTPGGLTSPNVLAGRQTGATDTSSRIAETQARLDELLLRFTDRHPDVVSANQSLAELKARQQEELQAFRRGDAAAIANSGLAANPVYQSIQLQMNQTDVEIATLRGELSDRSRAESELRKLLDTAPGVEAEFARLNRDYDVNRAQYTSLLERLEKAKISDDASQTGMANFDIVEPPNASAQPTSPKRPVLMLGALIFALGCGVAVAWLKTQLKPVFTSSNALAEATGLPVFGVVSETWTEARSHLERVRLMKLGGALTSLFVVFVAVTLFHSASSKFIHGLLSL